MQDPALFPRPDLIGDGRDQGAYEIPTGHCGDINGDGLCNLLDFARFALCFSKSGPDNACPPQAFFGCDFTGNGTVDLTDFATLALYFNTPPMDLLPDGCTAQ